MNRKRLLSITILVVLCIGALLGAVACSVTPTDEPIHRQNLRIFQSDIQFTQEQKLSQIKAQYLMTNNGYKDSDPVVVMVSGKSDALIERYKATGEEGDLAGYVSSEEGQRYLAEIQQEQNALIDELSSKGYVDEVIYRYSTVTNAIAIQTKYGCVEKIGKLSSVSDTMLSDTFNRPQTTDSEDTSAIVNAVGIYPTGIYDSSAAAALGYTGVGTSVAVLDSGFDLDHEVFANMPNCTEDKLSFKQSTIDALLANTQASTTTPNLKTYNVYFNAKIPFAYDYADKDYDVMPHDSEHGTHVAGIIAGKSETITGIAVDAQLVLLKVFPDLDDGGKTEDILAALEDAILLKVDAINMSLGSSCGFSREADNDKLNEIYDNIAEAGISLITAASNSYSSAFGGEQGNTNKVTNPDSSTVGSPSTYGAAMSVASISGTKSRYLVANGNQTFFYKESNSIAGKPNDFYAELEAKLLENGYTKEQIAKGVDLDYVTVPGVGLSVNYQGLNVKGKIALVKRGSNTFEEKAANAANAGAIACIIYNNIDGDILMSMGKGEHVPTISISKDDGTLLAQRSRGTIKLSSGYEAGPFMSDFSSWGPTPSLELKPEITAHGGDILSAIPGGKYDKLSGTSMATPNLCGIVVLIRQYLRQRYPTYTWKQINDLANQMLMSTATIVLNEEGNPYSPRKQGAGLASLGNVLNTRALITVDGKDRTKLELGDDPSETGVYVMQFNVKNISNSPVVYNVSTVGMTESVSSSDKTFVAETPHMLTKDCLVEFVSGNGTVNGKTVTVDANSSVSIRVTYTISDEDKEFIRTSFPYGMYVEGFVKLTKTQQNDVDLNVPFLAFFGDWTKAPMFDKTYYEVETEAKDDSIDAEDKIKADYYATTPYGSYYYNYIIPLGTYLYDLDPIQYEAIPATEDHIAISNVLGSIDGISSVYAGLLRGAKEMTFTITDKATGEVVYEFVDYNANKAYSLGSSPMPYYNFLRIKSTELNLVNNRQYEFNMVGKLDYGDGGLDTNVRNSFGFTFTMDDEAPVIQQATYEKVRDKTLKKDRYYVYLTVSDNHYVQSISPILFTSSRSYTFLTENPIPVYSEKGQATTVKIEITDFLDDIGYDAIINSALAFSVDDYALNSNIFFCQLPGTNGDFKFTKNGEPDGTEMIFLSVDEGEVVDLTQYLSTTDPNVDDQKDYLKTLTWSSSNTDVAEVKLGQLKAKKAGKTTIIVSEQMDLRQAVLIVNVRGKSTEEPKASATPQNAPALRAKSNASTTDSIESIRFAYFDTEFAYSRAAQTSEIGATGDRKFISAQHSISFYPGEKIKLHYDVKPWYVEDNYNYVYSSSNPRVATVDQDGVVTALKEGVTTIMLSVEGSNLLASIQVTVKNEFVIENRMLIAYKGLGGDVVIPDDEGILYIGAYAFCLYDTDNSIELTDDDYDANKIPSSNTTITSVVIPEGVEEIQKYAFYNCVGLRTVVLPSTLKYVREYAFYGDDSLKTITLVSQAVTVNDAEASNYLNADGSAKDGYKLNGNYIVKNSDFVLKENKLLGFAGTDCEVIARRAFSGCESLDNLDLSAIYSVGQSAFENCTSLSSVNLSTLRNTGANAFKGCTSLENVTLVQNTKLSQGMFSGSGLTSVDIYSKDCDIPQECFANCPKLTTVTIHNDIETIGRAAFSACETLSQVNIRGVVKTIAREAFYNNPSLTTFEFPNNQVSVGLSAFAKCDKLTTVKFGANTKLAQVYSYVTADNVLASENATNPAVNGYMFAETALSTFVVAAQNTFYTVSADGKLLLTDGGKTIALAAISADFGNYTIDGNIEKIAEGAFAGANVVSLIVPESVKEIGAYAFSRCSSLVSVQLSKTAIKLGNYAFYSCEKLADVANLDSATVIGNYAFTSAALTSVTIGKNAVCGEGCFYSNTKLTEVTIGANAKFGLGAFQRCTSLTTVNIAEEGNVYFGQGCFANDTALENIDLSRIGETIPRECFYGCSALRIANLANVKFIGDYAFADCAKLGVIKMPIVESIGECAFARYNQYSSTAPIFTEVALPDTLVKMGKGVFTGCSNLKSVTIPSSLNSLPDFTFAYCSALETVSLPSSVTVLGEYAFAGCELLSEINLESVVEVGKYCFASDASLTNVQLDSLEIAREGAFASSAIGGRIVANNLVLTELGSFLDTDITEFEAPNLKVIADMAFAGSDQLTRFVFSIYVTEIGERPFQQCTALKDFSYKIANNELVNGNINNYARLDNGVLYTKMSNGKYQLKCVPSAKDVGILEVAEGTVRIDMFAAGNNSSIHEIILPDSLQTIANYAFYGNKNLQIVEFRSVVAPTMESHYDSSLSLTEDDPGYDLLHNQFNLFDTELYYCNFIDLLGKNQPIKMKLPANDDISGYDGLTYLAYFGKVANAERSDYVAMQNGLRNFVANAEQILALNKITLANATLIDDAVTELNKVTQDPTTYGISTEQWNKMVTAVENARAELADLRLNASTTQIKRLQEQISSLPTQFNIRNYATLSATIANIDKQIEELKMEEKLLLDMTNYNLLMQSYNAYRQSVLQDVEPIVNQPTTQNAQAVLSALGAAVVAFFAKRKLSL